jgi:signal transduction histidine kinase
MSRTQRWRDFFNSIKGKIFALFLVTFLVAGALTALNVWTLAAVRERLVLSERYDDLLNNILEARRYEKNVLIYGDAASLAEGVGYLNQAEATATAIAPDMARVAGPERPEAILSALAGYRAALLDLGAGRKADAERVRGLGKRLVDLAEDTARTKRERIHHTIARVSLLPFGTLGVFILFMVFLIRVVAGSLLTPLTLVRQITGRVAKGDFSPVDAPGQHIAEIAGLLEALDRMARELEANQENLLQARKIAALGTLTAGIAHEINNPVNNIMLSAETLLETHGEILDADGKELAQDILGQAERAGDIVRNLLDFSRTEKAQISSLDPAEVVRSTLALLKNQIMIAGMKVRVELAPGLAAVAGNLRHLQQVFLNLVLNAVQATPAGGEVAILGQEDGDFVRLVVQDTGKGIAQEQQEHIFEPFYTTKDPGKGTGLGLAVSYSIVKRLGGRITVESAPGQGARFSVFLPKFAGRPENGGNGHGA